MRRHIEPMLLGAMLVLSAGIPHAAEVPALPAPPADTSVKRVAHAASARYFENHAEGWFWYHDPLEGDEEPPSAPTPVALPRQEDDPVAQIEAQRKALEIAMDRAILDPTPQNVEAYLEQNGRVLAQSAAFAEAWKGVLYTHPGLDYRQVSPVGNAAYVRADIERQDDERRLLEASGEWGLIFFFRGECPYCHQFAPVLKAFSERYGFRIVAVTLDGGGLPEFPSPQMNSEAGRALNVSAVPAVFLVNPHTREVVPAAYGLLGWSELSDRVLHALDARGKGPEVPHVASIGGTP